MTSYFVMRGEAGMPVALFRVRQSPGAVHTEELRDGAWVPSSRAGEFLFDRDPNDVVEEQEAARIARRLGGDL
jgi:hypothetical protein